MLLLSLAPNAVAVLDAGPRRDALKSALAAAGETVLSDDETAAAARALPNAKCTADDVDCLAKVVLLADAEALISVVVDADGSGSTILAVDGVPRVGRGRAAADDGIGPAAVAALASLRAQARGATHVDGGAGTSASTTTTVAAPPAPTAPPASAPAPSAAGPGSAAPPIRADRARSPAGPATSAEAPAHLGDAGASGGPWALAGAGLAGAGVVAIGVGCVAGVLAAQSVHAADIAHFQDDAAKLGDEANSRFWIGGVAVAVGASAVAAGAGLIVEGSGT